MEVDLTPLIGYAIEILAAVLMVLGTWALGRLTSWLGVKRDAEVNEHLDLILDRAIGYAKGWAASEAKRHASAVKIDNAFVGTAAKYASDHAPRLLRKAGLDEISVARLVEARLPDYGLQKED